MALDPLSSILSVGQSVIERIWPDANKRAEEMRKLEELKQTGDLKMMELHVKRLTSQMEVNKVEAGHPSRFVAGWRPFVGWVGGSSLAYAAILEPLMRFAATMYGYDGEFPEIDTSTTTTVLMGMLGIGAMRSYDKRNGTDTKQTK